MTQKLVTKATEQTINSGSGSSRRAHASNYMSTEGSYLYQAIDTLKLRGVAHCRTTQLSFIGIEN